MEEGYDVDVIFYDDSSAGEEEEEIKEMECVSLSNNKWKILYMINCHLKYICRCIQKIYAISTCFSSYRYREA